ncbi:uncharacterized protein LOC129943051 [Eupeodes corollae]|uniref:uncharacterized protein LOC129943051 n=1 Tax=Eupeodes corollae TaxID=290404 RepID=UPI002491ED1D|nr:uncharacterized protein LOC129943051 [Eupeodes corollae]
MNFELADLLEDDVEVLELIEVGVPRQVYDRNEYFFSFDEKMAIHVLEQIEKDLERPYNRNNSIPPINQLLVALRFFATGNHLLSIADFGGMHVSTVSRIVSRVPTGIAKLYRKYIKIPSTSSEVSQVKRDFFDIASFPSVIGAVDGTHVKIQSPGMIKYGFISHEIQNLSQGGPMQKYLGIEKAIFQ